MAQPVLDKRTGKMVPAKRMAKTIEGGVAAAERPAEKKPKADG